MYDRRDVLAGIGGVSLAVVGAAAPAAAEDDEDDEAKVRVAHAVPDAPAVDVLVDGTVAVAGAAFGDVTGYLELPAGEYDVAVNVAGTETTVFETTLAVEGADYTVAATGNLEPEGDEPGFGLDVFVDDLGRLFGDDGRVRVYHASPDAPAVDVAVAGPDDEPAVFLAEGIEFGEAGPNVEVAAGTYPVAVYPAGSSDPVFGPVEVEVREGEVLSVFAEGELDPEGDEAAFFPVLAYEEAAPFGRGPGGGPPGRGDDDDEEEDEGDDDEEEDEGDDEEEDEGDDDEEEDEGDDEEENEEDDDEEEDDGRGRGRGQGRGGPPR